MRRVLALLFVSLALASPAGADPKPAPKAAPPPAVVSAPQTALQPLIPLASGRSGGDTSHCLAACARSYYFCTAGGDDTCPGNWAQCNARCSSTYKRLGS